MQAFHSPRRFLQTGCMPMSVTQKTGTHWKNSLPGRGYDVNSPKSRDSSKELQGKGNTFLVSAPLGSIEGRGSGSTPCKEGSGLSSSSSKIFGWLVAMTTSSGGGAGLCLCQCLLQNGFCGEGPLTHNTTAAPQFSARRAYKFVHFSPIGLTW